jgi:hypothetical protein
VPAGRAWRRSGATGISVGETSGARSGRERGRPVEPRVVRRRAQARRRLAGYPSSPGPCPTPAARRARSARSPRRPGRRRPGRHRRFGRPLPAVHRWKLRARRRVVALRAAMLTSADPNRPADHRRIGNAGAEVARQKMQQGPGSVGLTRERRGSDATLRPRVPEEPPGPSGGSCARRTSCSRGHA